MSDDSEDKSQKTEEPSQKKLDEAAEKGNVPISKEVGVTLSTLAVVIAVAAMGNDVASGLAGVLETFLSGAHQYQISPDNTSDAIGGMGVILQHVIVIIAPVFGLIIAAALLAGRLQGPFRVSLERLKPKASNISPMSGVKKIASPSALVEFLKSVVKVSVVAFCATLVVIEALEIIPQSYDRPPNVVPVEIRALILKMLIYVFCAMAVIMILDIFWKRFDHRKKLRMSRKELKDEHKQMEGDPHVKAKVAELRQTRSQERRKMMGAVPTATVVVANPTHFAVALKYEHGVHDAPVCVAKGVDAIALQIRSLAEDADVPVVENPPLARTLYPVVELDQVVPYEHWEAVAAVINYVMKMRAK